jgi:hypothetical protein
MRVGDAHCAAIRFDRRLREHFVAEPVRHRLRAHQLVRAERTGNIRLEDVELLRVRRVSQQIGGHAEILGKNLGRHVLEPVTDEKRAVLIEAAAIEHQQKFAAIGTETLDAMRHAGWEIPEIADSHVIDEIAALRIDRGDPRSAVQHVGPLGFLVPVQLADAAGVQAHVDAGNGFGNAQFTLGSPAARLRLGGVRHVGGEQAARADGKASQNVAPVGWWHGIFLQVLPVAAGQEALPFEKGNKNFALLALALRQNTRFHNKSFLVLFFKKEHLSSCRPYTNCPRKNPKAGKGRQAFGTSARRIGATLYCGTGWRLPRRKPE